MKTFGIIVLILFVLSVIGIIVYFNLSPFLDSMKKLKKQIKNAVKHIQEFEEENFGQNKNINIDSEEIIVEYEELFVCDYCGHSFSQSKTNCPKCGATYDKDKK